MKYIGIIDDYGLESFKKDSGNNQFFYKMRAGLNPHRNARVYEVEMTEKEGNVFDVKIRLEQDWKKHAEELKAMKSFKWVME